MKKVVIIIDEIDNIAILGQGRDRLDNEAALQTLWGCLDKIKDNKNIIVIFTTNNFNKLHKTFVSRFSRLEGIIEINNPFKPVRIEIIKFYFEKNKIEGFADADIDQLAVLTKGLSARDIEFLIEESLAESQQDGKIFSVELIKRNIGAYKPKFVDQIKENVTLDNVYKVATIGACTVSIIEFTKKTINEITIVPPKLESVKNAVNSMLTTVSKYIFR